MSQKRKQKEIKKQNRLKAKNWKLNIKRDDESKLYDDSELINWKQNFHRSTSFKNGMELEVIVKRLCLRLGVPDLILRGPLYKDNKGIDKELCDLLIPIGETLIVFQIKHKILDPEKESDTILQRADKTVDKTRKQFNTLLKYIKSNSLGEYKTEGGLSLNLSERKFSDIVLIGIVAFPGVDEFPELKQFEIQNGFLEYQSYPLHIFELNDFDKISLELDTLTDLLNYLKIRKDFFVRANLGLTTELDFLGFYKMQGEKIDKYINGAAKVVLAEGTWRSYLDRHGHSIIKRNKDNIESYIFDKLLHRLKSSLGFNPYKRNQEVLHPPGSVDAYIAILNEMGKITRLERRGIAEAIKVCLVRAEINLSEKGFPYAYRFIIYESNPSRGFLVLSNVEGELNRDERISFLSNLAQSAFYHFKVESIIGLATESISCSRRSEDFISIGGEIKWEGENLKFVERLSQEFWQGKKKYIVETEFKE